MKGIALMDYELTVNGEAREVRAPAGATLLTVLRDQLGLTGAKRGCNQGVCGVCTVLIDGKPMRACLLVAAACGHREVVTVEGLGDDMELSPVQRAFVEHGAVQCGFCTPAMVVTISALLRDHPAPDRETVRDAVSGNLCRCSGYVKIVDAAMTLSRRNAP